MRKRRAPKSKEVVKATNPKDAAANGKIPLHLVPAVFIARTALGLLDGALKYGRMNWRASEVRASVYLDAALRHLTAWSEGQPTDPESGLCDLDHAAACLAILMDARAAGTLIDDRNFPGGYMDELPELTAHVGRLKALHARRDAPHHYTITDAPA